MLRIIFFLLLTLSLSSQKLMNLERCYDPYNKKFLKNCCILTDAQGFPVYLTEAECQLFYGTNSTKVCQAIGDFSISTLLSTDYIVAKGANSCKLVKITDIVSPSNLCFAFGQLPKLNYNRGDLFLMQRPDGTCYRDSINWSVYGGLDCNGVIDCISNNPLFCEEVENCLTNGVLCTALNSIQNSTYVRGDKLIYIGTDGSCYSDSIHWDQYGGLDCEGVIDCIETNPDFCIAVQNCINSTYICETLNGFGGMNFIPEYLIGINNGQCAKVDGNLFGSNAICSNLNLLGYSGAVDTVFGTYNGQCYKVALPQGSSWNCDSTTFCINQFLCDSIESCLENNPKFDTLVCEALHSFPFQQASSTGDTVIAVNGGICYKTVINTSNSTWNCDSTINCVNQFLCDSVIACISNSLFACEEVESSWQVGQLGNGALLLINDGTGCKKAQLGFENTSCISMGLSGSGNFTAAPIISNDAGNKLECRTSGFYSSGLSTCAELESLFTTGGQIGQSDLIMTSGCVFKTLGNQLSCPNIGAAFPQGGSLAPGDEVLVYSDAGCQRKTLPCYDPCGGVPDINPLLLRMTSRLEVLEKENRELKKIIKEIQNKLK